MFSLSQIVVVFALVVLPTVVDLSQSSTETVNTHICYYLNKNEEVYIPIAAIFGYPKEKRLLLFDYLGMYYEVGANDDNAIRLSPNESVSISLEKATTGQWEVRWPGLTSVVAGDTEAIVYQNNSWFCFFNKTEDGKHTGKCFNKNGFESMDFNESLLKHATSDDFHEKFQSLTKCRVKSSLKSNDEDEFTMLFIEKTNLEEAIKNESLECPVAWRTTEAYNASLFEYDGVVFIINLLYAFAFRRSGVVGGGSTIVSRIPLKRLFRCDPKMVIKRETFAFGLSLQSFILITVCGFFALFILFEMAYIAGAFETPDATFYHEQRPVANSKRKRVKKRKKKTPATKKTKKIESLISADSVEQVPSATPSQMQEMPADEIDETVETTPIADTIGPSTGFSPTSNAFYNSFQTPPINPQPMMSAGQNGPLIPAQQTPTGNYGMHSPKNAPAVHNYPPPLHSAYEAQTGNYPNQPSTSGGYYSQPPCYPYEQGYYPQQQQHPSKYQ